MVGLLDTSRHMRQTKRIALNAVLANGAVTAPSLWLAESIRRASASLAHQVRVVANPVDLDVFSPGSRTAAREAFTLPATEFTVVMAAASLQNHMKGIELGARAIARLSFQRAVCALIVGEDGRYLADRLGRARCVLTGRLDRRERMADAFRAADVCLVPSLAESFCLVAAESMACGTPVVAFDVTALGDNVIPGHTGWLAPTGDPDALADLLLRLASDPDERLRLGCQARDHAQRHFPPARFVQAFLDIYASLLAPRRQAAPEGPQTNRDA